MYYVAKRIMTKEFKINEGELISLPITLAIPCDLIKMNIDSELNTEKYEVVLRKVFNKDKGSFNSSLPIYDSNDNCINSEIVNSIYEDNEELKKKCYEANMRMLIVQTLGNRECYNELREQYNSEIDNYYNEIEEKVLYRKK